MKIDKTVLIAGGVGIAIGALLWPKIKENFSFNTIKAPPPERIFPGKNVFPVEGKAFPGQGHAYGLDDDHRGNAYGHDDRDRPRGIGYAYGHDITHGRGPHLA
jgi:hypothetical protein